MKKRISILGSTGSIGDTLLKIIMDNKSILNIDLLSANKNYKKILKQEIKFNVKNVIIHDFKKFKESKKIFSKKKIISYNSVKEFKKKNRTKFDYSMVGITGFYGLKPTLELIQITKKIAIANKESIICGWNLIQKELKRNKTKFVPIDSEHFSIDELIKNRNIKDIKKIYLTASGGPFLNKKSSDFKVIKVEDAIKHPTWQMGKKISIDSATLINKVFEVIEAKKIFNIDYSKLDILIQPTSYVHSLVQFYGGTTHYLVHEPSMKIPIFNSIIDDNKMKKDYFKYKFEIIEQFKNPEYPN